MAQGNDESVAFIYDFPMSVMDLARSCAATVDELDPFTRDRFAQEASPGVSTMSDAELITALQQALGQVRPFNKMDADD